jgi:DNA-binding transcriptional MerR regulator
MRLMAAPDNRDRLIALPAEAAAELAHVSVRRLRYWDQTKLVVPSIKRSFGPRSNVRLYAFNDLVNLLVVSALLRNGFSLRHVRKVVSYLRRKHGYEAPLRELRFAIAGNEIFFQHPDGTWEGDRSPDQVVLEHVLPLQQIKARIRGAVERKSDDSGRVVRRRKVMGRKPVFAGTRIPVSAVVEYLERGYTAKQIMEEFPILTEADIAKAKDSIGAA